MTTAPTTTPWYDSHENLYTLAEWIREHNGWAFFEKNAIDLLETPWRWENEWRLASGNVEFKLIERPRDILDDPLPEGIETDRNQCVWCKCLVGLVSFEHELGGMHEVEWVTIYVDNKSGDYACDDCAGSAPNFKETTAESTPDLPELTDEMRTHFAAFDAVELFPVMITRDVTTELGNVLIEEGTRTWGARNAERFSSISVWTKDTHYAGVKSSSIPSNCYVRLAGAAVML